MILLEHLATILVQNACGVVAALKHRIARNNNTIIQIQIVFDLTNRNLSRLLNFWRKHATKTLRGQVGGTQKSVEKQAFQIDAIHMVIGDIQLSTP